MKSTKPILHQPSFTMPMLLLLAYITYAAAVDVKSDDYDDKYPNKQIKVEHWGDAVVTAVTAWNVMVVVSLRFVLIMQYRFNYHIIYSIYLTLYVSCIYILCCAVVRLLKLMISAIVSRQPMMPYLHPATLQIDTLHPSLRSDMDLPMPFLIGQSCMVLDMPL